MFFDEMDPPPTTDFHSRVSSLAALYSLETPAPVELFNTLLFVVVLYDMTSGVRLLVLSASSDTPHKDSPVVFFLFRPQSHFCQVHCKAIVRLTSYSGVYCRQELFSVQF